MMMAGQCPECGTVIQADDPPALASLIVQHQCDPDLWLAQQEAAQRRHDRDAILPTEPLAFEVRLELERTRYALRWAHAVIIVEALVLLVNFGLRMAGQ